MPHESGAFLYIYYMCPDCLKDKPIWIKGICKSCYRKAYNKKAFDERKATRENWWKTIQIQPEHKEVIRMSLIRFKYSYEQPLDYMILVHFYLMYKAPWMAEFPDYNQDRTLDKIKPELRKIFK
jgi:hypothetical protein